MCDTSSKVFLESVSGNNGTSPALQNPYPPGELLDSPRLAEVSAHSTRKPKPIYRFQSCEEMSHVTKQQGTEVVHIVFIQALAAFACGHTQRAFSNCVDVSPGLSKFRKYGRAITCDLACACAGGGGGTDSSDTDRTELLAADVLDIPIWVHSFTNTNHRERQRTRPLSHSCTTNLGTVGILRVQVITVTGLRHGERVLVLLVNGLDGAHRGRLLERRLHTRQGRQVAGRAQRSL